MKRILPLACASALLTLASASVLALDFRSVGVAAAVMFDAPSERGHKVFVAPRGMPVEVVLTSGAWSKVRDAAGDLAWIESKALDAKRNLVVKVAQARVRATPDEAATPVMMAGKGVLLEYVERAAAGWVRVAHRDGGSGYVKANEVWGD